MSTAQSSCTDGGVFSHQSWIRCSKLQHFMFLTLTVKKQPICVFCAWYSVAANFYDGDCTRIGRCFITAMTRRTLINGQRFVLKAKRGFWYYKQIFPLIDLVLAMTVLLPVWNSHCTRVRFTVVVSCSDELAVHSCPLLCLQRWVAKVASGLFYCWSLLRNNNMATNLQRFALYYGSRRFVAWDCWTQTSWQVMQRDSDMRKARPDFQLWATYICTLWKEAWVGLQQCFHKFEKSIIICASVTNVPECQTKLMQDSFHAV